ncbi:hypothetical protein GFC01_06155 [Desulfofundulus thermobenzoicus]|uniref:Uncharacterized protein n=1 Tax=Desulfofundulus thermobenzoicus TaxID=29376 RepID=A0A6N7IQI6_9FIRM|nr:hypothetical protein [Desulfofundulus thermobenzoicus]MQL51853.1 hypothetical protein [Desulfofundulus thermobenzoicus]
MLMINDGRLHLLVSSSMVNLEYIEDSLEREEAFYRSYGFTVAILNEREEYSDVEFIINKPSEIDLDIDYDRVASGQTISETTNQIHIKINLSKGVFILPIKRIELSDSKVNSFRGSNRLLIFEIRSDSFRNIPKEKMCLIVQVVIKIT